MPAQKLSSNQHSLKILKMEPSPYPVLGQGGNEDSDSTAPALAGEKRITSLQIITVIVLCYVNLINYMDRFTVAGVLTDIQKHYGIGDDKGGLLQTAFVVSYMIFAPIFGYLGDRHSRKFIMASGVGLWSLTTFVGSFMENYWWFLFFRALVGIGEASYSTIAPTIISDLFVKDTRSRMLGLFYFAIPVGSGLGYIVGSEMGKATGQWQYGLRLTPALGLVAVILILFVMRDPARGESEHVEHLIPTSYVEDLKDLVQNRSFMLSTAGYTCVAFVTGALAWWGPKFILSGINLQPGSENVVLSDVAYIFGIIAMVAGLLGVPSGSFLSERLRGRWPRIDPLICASGLGLSLPILFAASLLPNVNSGVCYFLMFIGQFFLNLNWAVVADLLLYVVIPTRRSTAEAFQILVAHALGDAGSPYLIGVVSEALKERLSSSQYNATNALGESMEDPEVKFHSLQYALFITSFVELLGAVFFWITSMYVVNDRQRADMIASGGIEKGNVKNMFADETIEHQEQRVNLIT